VLVVQRFFYNLHIFYVGELRGAVPLDVSKEQLHFLSRLFGGIRCGLDFAG
jgi:hypothetical protein